jgi:heme-degrading monooxygenase HmoA
MLMLGGYSRLMPSAMPHLGVLVLSGWTSVDERKAFRDTNDFRNLADHSRLVSIDLGAGVARSRHRDLVLNDDGWLDRLPVGKAPRGFVAALTYAHVTPRGAWPFHRIAREASLSARQTDGFVGSVFATEFRAPVLRVMTFTVWEPRSASAQWAYSGDTHLKALSWLTESPERMPGGCFGLFPILAASGTFNGVDLAAKADALLNRTKAK